MISLFLNKLKNIYVNVCRVCLNWCCLNHFDLVFMIWLILQVFLLHKSMLSSKLQWVRLCSYHSLLVQRNNSSYFHFIIFFIVAQNKLHFWIRELFCMCPYFTNFLVSIHVTVLQTLYLVAPTFSNIYKLRIRHSNLWIIIKMWYSVQNEKSRLMILMEYRHVLRMVSVLRRCHWNVNNNKLKAIKCILSWAILLLRYWFQLRRLGFCIGITGSAFLDIVLRKISNTYFQLHLLVYDGKSAVSISAV